MKLYYVKDRYIDYLKQFDSKVANNKSQTRPYIGVVLKIGEINYFAPLSSPKPKHLKMKQSIDLFKIKNGEYGVINLNNMIPVPLDKVIELNIEKELDIKYKELLKRQIIYIRENKISIYNKASKLRNILIDNNVEAEHRRILKARSCNLKLLEEKYFEYINH